MNPPEHVGSSQLSELRKRLSTRDWQILRFLSRHRYATTGHLRRTFFREHASQAAATRACIRVLDRLLELRLLTRLDRRVGGHGHGSAAFVWHLDAVGDRLTRTSTASRRRFEDPSLVFLDHTLAITEATVTLMEAEHTGLIRIARLEIETESWRPYLAASGGATVLKPDLALTTSTSDYDDHWYIEIDRGTESIPVLIRKCQAYEAYRRTGRAQAEHRVFPRVLWVLPTQRRVARLRAAIAADRTLPDRLFATATPEYLLETIGSPQHPSDTTTSVISERRTP